MQKLLFIPLLLAVFFSACKQDSKTADTKEPSLAASPDMLGGYWIAIDFCARANQYGSVLQAVENAYRPYTYALTFNPGMPDSVGCYNGFETWNVPVKYNADTLELVGAIQGRSVFLIYDSKGNQDMTMFSFIDGNTRLDKFIKSKAGAKDGVAAFHVALNHNLFSGMFTPLGKGAKTAVQFTPGGFVQGLKEYDRYEVCLGGDCFVASDLIDIVTFSKAQTENSEKILGFRYSAQNDTLTFYDMVNTNPNEKGAFTVGKVAYQFLRKKAE